MWVSPSVVMPAVGREVLCKLQHCDSKAVVEHRLVHVDESDVTWRTSGDLAEVSYDWNVTQWLDA